MTARILAKKLAGSAKQSLLPEAGHHDYFMSAWLCFLAEACSRGMALVGWGVL